MKIDLEIKLDTEDDTEYLGIGEKMPKHSHLAMLYGDPKNYEPPMTIEQARKKGYTDFFFYPTFVAANDASYDHCIQDEKLRTIVFDEYVKVGKEKFVLHVLGMTPRPKPVIKTYPALMHGGHGRTGDHSKINAFAIFMGEWAVKLRKVVSR